MLLLDSISKDLSPWLSALRNDLGQEVVTLWEQLDDPEKVQMAVVWKHRPELFRQLPNLKLVASLGAGVDHIVSDPLLPSNVAVSKVVSEHLSGPMANFCIGAVLYFHRQFDKYQRDKSGRIWDQQFDPEIPMRIGILGLGVLGTELARRLQFLGFEVSGLSRTKRMVPGVVCYDMSELDEFLAQTKTLICMLPSTPSTQRILNKKLFDKMMQGSYLINVGRGNQQVDNDILEALESGRLAGAFLDVFPEEPLPADSKLWTHPKVFITPHIAVVTKIEAAVPQIVDNYQRLKANKPLINLIDRGKGY